VWPSARKTSDCKIGSSRCQDGNTCVKRSRFPRGAVTRSRRRLSGPANVTTGSTDRQRQVCAQLRLGITAPKKSLHIAVG